MNLNPGTVLGPVFHFLDETIADYGVYLYLVLVWMSLILITWIFSGGLRKKYPNQPCVRTGIGIITQPHAPPPPPVIIHEFDSSDDDMD
jgi:hypothetical protein